MNSYDAIVVTHGHCQDGTSSAWVVREYLNGKAKERGDTVMPNIRYVFGMNRDLDKDLASTAWKDNNTGTEHPALTLDDFEGKHVWILDYIYPVESIQRIKYKTLTIIDHHKGNKDILEGCKRLDDGYMKVRVFFEEKYSAAGLAWREYYSLVVTVYRG